MGWGRMFLLGNVGQQLDIEEMRAEMRQLRAARRAETTHSEPGERADQDGRFRALQRENDEPRLYLAAVIRHMLAKKLLLRTELEALVSEIDTEDGSDDGLHAGPVV